MKYQINSLFVTTVAKRSMYLTSTCQWENGLIIICDKNYAKIWQMCPANSWSGSPIVISNWSIFQAKMNIESLPKIQYLDIFGTKKTQNRNFINPFTFKSGLQTFMIMKWLPFFKISGCISPRFCQLINQLKNHRSWCDRPLFWQYYENDRIDAFEGQVHKK